MSKKIVFLHGVSGTPKGKFLFLKNQIEKRLDVTVDLFKWKSEWPYEIPKGLSFLPVRSAFCSVLTDIEHAILHTVDIANKLPEADAYIAHSAGSILALAQDKKPVIAFGSPAMLVETLSIRRDKKIRDVTVAGLVGDSRPVLNIICASDIIAYPLDFDNVENWIYKMTGLDLTNIFFSHTNYFTNLMVINKMVEKLYDWGIDYKPAQEPMYK